MELGAGACAVLRHRCIGHVHTRLAWVCVPLPDVRSRRPYLYSAYLNIFTLYINIVRRLAAIVEY